MAAIEKFKAKDIVEVPNKRQKTIPECIVQKVIPIARSGREAWCQWFIPDPKIGLVRGLKDFSKDMIRMNRKRYSERKTLANAFVKYRSFDEFELAYAGFTDTYAKLFNEVRRRKKSNNL
ncbi:unnamed protein product [Aphanomyces euteiches]